MKKRDSRRRVVARGSVNRLVDTALTRRQALLGMAAAGIAATLSAPRARAAAKSSLTFKELTRIADAEDHWPDGYSRQVLIRWGDPLLPDAPPFDPASLTVEAAARQFGYNNDLTVFVPLPFGSGSSEHGLLVVSHEYANPHVMFAGMTEDEARTKMSDAQVRVTQAACGLSVIEVRKAAGRWEIVGNSDYARRITFDTPMRLSGPAAGHDWLKTRADPTGTQVLGTAYNCNGGLTPWGTVLSGEEGVADLFGGDFTRLPDQDLVARYGEDEEDSDYYGWTRVAPRLSYDEEPNERFRFNWVVEIDPLDPAATPVKRTALGRFAHEGAQTVVNADGRVVVYMGDDDDFEYMYKFVTRGTVDPNDRSANRDLLDDGTLYVARFNADQTVDWLPLVQGEGPLTAANGFASQADLLLRTRVAADLVGATPMDAPEGFVPSAATGRVYVALTENEDRETANDANPRTPNPQGHVLELVPPGAGTAAVDHAATRFSWEVFVLCGNPAKAEAAARYHPATSDNGWFTDPDNLCVDGAGRLWVTTDGPPDEGFADALYAMDTAGDGRALPKLFYVPPAGCEVCSPWFTPDGRTLFFSVQHPAEDSDTLETASTRWPDFADGVPPRPSVVVITREDGGVVGS